MQRSRRTRGHNPGLFDLMHIIVDCICFIRSRYITESPNIHCHNMEDPTQLYSFNYFINTKKLLYTTMYNLPQSMRYLKGQRETPTMGKQLVNFITCVCAPS
jgi:hypothetical protein